MSLEFERRKQRVAAILLHPGTVDTDLSKPFQKVSGRVGARAGGWGVMRAPDGRQRALPAHIAGLPSLLWTTNTCAITLPSTCLAAECAS